MEQLFGISYQQLFKVCSGTAVTAFLVKLKEFLGLVRIFVFILHNI